MSVATIIETFYKRGHGIEAEQFTLDDIDNKILLKANVEALKESPDLYPYIVSLFMGSQGNSKECSRRLGKVFIAAIELFKLGKFAKQEASELFELMLSVIRHLSVKQTDSSILAILNDFSPDPLSVPSINGHGCVLQLVPQLVSRNGLQLCRTYTVEMICEMTFPVTSAVILSATLVDLSESRDDLLKSITKIKAHVKWNSSSLEGKSSPHLAGDRESRDLYLVEPEDLPALVYQLTNLTRKFEKLNDNALTALAKKMVVEALTDVLDSLFHEACEIIDSYRGTGSVEAMRSRIYNILSTIVHHLSLLVSKDQGVSSEIVKLIKSRSMLVVRTVPPSSASARGAPTSTTALVSSEPPILTSFPTSLPSQSKLSCPPKSDHFHLSPSRLLLSFLSAKAPRLEDAVISGLCESIHEVYISQSLHLQSMWFSSNVWAQASQSLALTPISLQRLFTQILRGPLMVEGIMDPLMKFACGLLQLSPSGGSSNTPVIKALSSLSSVTLAISSAPYDSVFLQTALMCTSSTASTGLVSSSASGFGAWLLIQLFIFSPHARLPIIRDVVQRLQMMALAASDPNNAYSGGPSTGGTLPSFQSAVHVDQSPLEKILLGVLSHLTSSEECLEGIVDSSQGLLFARNQRTLSDNSGSIVQELMELFMALPTLLPRTAGHLVQLMVPLLRRSSCLADRCALSLRKASFSKDVGSRLSAVSALMTLLRVQLVSPQEMSTEVDSSSQSNGLPPPQPKRTSHPIPGVLSIEEILSLCRRFMHHQASVRSLLYDHLLHLHSDVPSFRSLSIRLLRTHLLTLLLDNDTDVGGSRYHGGSVHQMTKESLDILSVESPRHLLFLNLDSCVDSRGDTLEALCDLLNSLASMVNTSTASLLVLRAKHEQAIQAEDQVARHSEAEASSQRSCAENDDCGHYRVFPQSQMHCTQYGYFSQAEATSTQPHSSTSLSTGVSPASTITGARSRSTSRSQRRLDEFSREVDETFAVLWKMCCGLARGTPQDFALPPQPSTRQEYMRYVVLVEALQAALNCVAMLPGMPPTTTTLRSETDLEVNGEQEAPGCLESRPSLPSHPPEGITSTEKKYLMQYLTPSHRLLLFSKLAQQLEIYSTVLLVYRKQAKEADKFRTKTRGGNGKSSAADDAPGTADGNGSGGPHAATVLPLPKLIGEYQSLESINVHCIAVELEMCTFGLEELFMTRSDVEENDDDDDNEEGASAAILGEKRCDLEHVATEEASASLRSSATSPFLRKHILERSLRCLELVLKFIHVQAISSLSASQRGEEVLQRAVEKQGNGHNDRIVLQCHHLFQCLMRVLIKLRSEDKESSCEMGTQHQKNFHTANNSNITAAGGTVSRSGGRSVTGTQGEDRANVVIAVGSLVYPSNSQHQYLYPNQLVLRCMLGCLRAENMHSCHLSTHLSFKSADLIDTEEDGNTSHTQALGMFRVERLTTLLEKGFKVGHSGRRPRENSSSAHYMSATGLTCGTAPGTVREMESRLEKQARKFLDLFLLLSAPDGHERCEGPLVVSLLAEVAEVISPARRQKFQGTVLKKCSEHLNDPSSAITVSLLQLLVNKLPRDAQSRMENLRQMCSLVAECCTTEQQFDEDREDNNEDDEDVERDVTTYTVVTKRTAATAITSLVGMLDKMCGEMDLLMKLSAKTMKVSKVTSSLSCLTESSSATGSNNSMQHVWGDDIMHTGAASNEIGELDGWRVNDQICQALRVCMDTAALFLEFKSPGAVSHSILGLFLKLIKLQVKMTKLVNSMSAMDRAEVMTSPRYHSFRDLSLNMSSSLSKALNRYVTEVHNLLGGQQRGRHQKGAPSGGKALHKKLSRLIPELIYQTEEYDLSIIKLMGGMKERDKGIASKWLCKVAARDFRLTEASATQAPQIGRRNRGHKRKSGDVSSSSARERENVDEQSRDE